MARQICWRRLYVLQNSQIVARSRSQGCRAVAIFRARKLRHVQVIKFNADLSIWTSEGAKDVEIVDYH
jgi:hypothetical protein